MKDKAKPIRSIMNITSVFLRFTHHSLEELFCRFQNVNIFALDGPVEFRLKQFYLEPILAWVSVQVFVDWIDKPRAGRATTVICDTGSTNHPLYAVFFVNPMCAMRMCDECLNYLGRSNNSDKSVVWDEDPTQNGSIAPQARRAKAPSIQCWKALIHQKRKSPIALAAEASRWAFKQVAYIRS